MTPAVRTKTQSRRCKYSSLMSEKISIMHMSCSTGFFEVVTANGIGLADAVIDDLAILTTNASQRILIGCGEGSVSSMVVAGNGVSFNAPLNMSRLSVSNLTVSDAVVANSIISAPITPAPLSVKNYNGPIAVSATQRVSISIANPSPEGAFQVIITDRERMRVAANGFVGIGTSLPAATLDVGGSIAINGVPILNAQRDMSDIASLSVDGRISLSTGLLRTDPINRTLTIGSNVAASISGTLSVSGTTTLGSGLVISSGDLRVNDSTLYVDSSNSKVGIRTTAPRYELDVQGTIASSVGSIGPTFLIVSPLGFTDVGHSAYLTLDASIEPGNPAAGAPGTPFFGGLSLLGGDASGEGAVWSMCRFIFRGVLLANDMVGNPISRMAVHRYDMEFSHYVAATPLFDLENLGTSLGYRYFCTPWFAHLPMDAHYALFHLALDQVSAFRIGSVHVQFK